MKKYLQITLALLMFAAATTACGIKGALDLPEEHEGEAYDK